MYTLIIFFRIISFLWYFVSRNYCFIAHTYLRILNDHNKYLKLAPTFCYLSESPRELYAIKTIMCLYASCACTIQIVCCVYIILFKYSYEYTCETRIIGVNIYNEINPVIERENFGLFDKKNEIYDVIDVGRFYIKTSRTPWCHYQYRCQTPS